MRESASEVMTKITVQSCFCGVSQRVETKISVIVALHVEEWLRWFNSSDVGEQLEAQAIDGAHFDLDVLPLLVVCISVIDLGTRNIHNFFTYISHMGDPRFCCSVAIVIFCSGCSNDVH